jgi:hypothetical protein
VIECRRNKPHRVVAQFTSLREATGNVVGIRSAVEVFNMTGHSRSVTTGATYVHVRSRKGKRGLGMIEHRTGPGGGNVADRAVRRETCCLVIRIRRLKVHRDVARCAVLRRSRILTVPMALQTGNRHMSPRQGERSHGVVVELGIQPRRC